MPDLEAFFAPPFRHPVHIDGNHTRAGRTAATPGEEALERIRIALRFDKYAAVTPVLHPAHEAMTRRLAHRAHPVGNALDLTLDDGPHPRHIP